MSEATPELGVGAADRHLGVDAGMAAEIDGGEDDVAEFLADRGGPAGGEGGAQFADLLLDLVENGFRLAPVETDLAGLLLEVERLAKRRLAARDIGKQAGLGSAVRLAEPGPPFGAFGLLGGLYLVPLGLDRIRRPRVGRTEDVRVPSDHLAGDRLDDVAEVEDLLLLGNAGMEDDLQEEVAEFLAEVGQIATLDRVGDLVGLFQRVGLYGFEGLPDVPRTAGLRLSQRGHDLDEASDIT